MISALILALIGLPDNYYQCQVISIHDGDTITANIQLEWDVALFNKSIRLLDYDAWEISRARKTIVITDEELIKGKKAKEALETLIHSAEAVYIQAGKYQGQETSYNRIYGRMFLKLPKQDQLLEVSSWMIKEGYNR